MSTDSIVDMRNQYAVYWAKVGQDRSATPIVAAGRQFKVQVEKRFKQSTDANARAIEYDYMINVPERLVVGSILWLGEILDLPAQPSFSFQDWNITDLLEIMDCEEYPDDTGLLFDRWVGANKYGGTMPTLQN